MVPQHDVPPVSAEPYRLPAPSAVKPPKGFAPSPGGPLKAWSTVKVWACVQHARANIIQTQVTRTAIVVKGFSPQTRGALAAREHQVFMVISHLSSNDL